MGDDLKANLSIIEWEVWGNAIYLLRRLEGRV